MCRIFAVLLISLFAPLSVNAEPLTLKYFQSDNRYQYHISLLTLAMDLTRGTGGPYQIQPLQESVTQRWG